jgi:CubicO group peptidase (beta-lactamase class C family)
MKVLLLVAALLAPASVAAFAQSGPLCATPEQASDGWRVADPGAEGMDKDRLCRIGPRFAGKNVHAVLVARHGMLVYERYFTGEDPSQLGSVTFDANTKHDLRSVSKSVVSLILGIAIGKGQISDLYQPVLPMLVGYQDLRTPELDRITLRHLLTMTQGLAWDEEDYKYGDVRNDETAMAQSPDPIRYVFTRPIVAPPSAYFKYSSASGQIIARLLRQATGQPIDALARTTLFEPLGITDFDWRTFRRSGEPSASGGLRLRPRDALKIGQLVLNHGEWHGRQVVPADWIEAATSSQLVKFYGYQFWLGHSPSREGPVAWAAAKGLGGQRIYIVPSLDLAVVVLAGLYGASAQDAQVLPVLDDFALPAVRE